MNFTGRHHSVQLSLICDNVRDPGNLGTMLRCAAAAGCYDVLLTKGTTCCQIKQASQSPLKLLEINSFFLKKTGCVDVWEPKVLRAAMGAHFRLPVFSNLEWDDIERRLPKSLTVHIADSSCGSNISQEMTYIQVGASCKPSKAGDYGWVSTRGRNKNMHYQEYESDWEDEEHHPTVDTKIYHESWAQGPTALVIGGETHGLSEEAVQLAEKTGGHRLFIPIVPNVDSLNSAMAASILLLEGRRQLLKRMQST